MESIDTPGSTTRPAPVAEYQLRDLEGNLVAIKGRFEEDGQKKFAFKLPGSDAWDGLKGLKVEELPPYNLEGLVGGNPEEWVVITEGEKAADAHIAQGGIAISWVGGAGQQVFGYVDALKGRKVAVWPDNDQVGMDYATRVRKALLPIARRVITLPIDDTMAEKADAADFYASGGDFSELLKRATDGVSIQVDSHREDHVRVTMNDIATGISVQFDFDQITWKRQELMADASVEVPSEWPTPQYVQRLNAYSASSREQWARALGKHFEGCPVNWTKLINTAIAKLKEHYADRDKAIDLMSLADDDEEVSRWLIPGLIPLNQPTVVFGDGDTGKSWIVYAMAIAVATGAPVVGPDAIETGAVLVIDYEMDAKFAKLRLKRLIEGSAPGAVADKIFYWRAGGIPLAEQIEPIRRVVAEHKIKLVIVDSAGPAVNGAPEEAQIALGYFNALASLGVTTITIAHVPKNAMNPDRPFGSTFWHNMSRRTFFTKSDKSDPSNLSLALVPKKFSHGEPRTAPFAYRVSFQGDEGTGPVCVEPVDIRNAPGFDSVKPMGERVKIHLTNNGESTWPQLMRGLKITTDTDAQRLTKILTHGVKEGWWVKDNMKTPPTYRLA